MNCLFHLESMSSDKWPGCKFLWSPQNFPVVISLLNFSEDYIDI